MEEAITRFNPEDLPPAPDRWEAEANKGRIHLIAGSGKIVPTPNSPYGSIDTAIADVVAVWLSATQVATYGEVYISQAWLRRWLDPREANLTGGALLYGRLVKKRAPGAKNDSWQLEEITPDQLLVVKAWREANLAGDKEAGYSLASANPPAPATNPQPETAAQAQAAPAGDGFAPPEENLESF